MDINNERIADLSISDKKSEIVQFVFGICGKFQIAVGKYLLERL